MATTKKSTKAVVKKDNFDVAKQDQAVVMSKVLRDHIVQQSLFTNIKGKNFAHVDGWQFAGALMNTYPVVTRVKELSAEGDEVKWLAHCEIREYKTDKKVGFGSAVCSNKERNKKGFEEYAILSMAQTRAIGKAYRNRVGWIMKLAGYESTPAEEMVKTGKTTKKTKKTQQKATQGEEKPTKEQLEEEMKKSDQELEKQINKAKNK